MKSAIFILIFLPATLAFGQTKIECTAQVYESFSDGTSRQNKVPLTIETENAAHLVLSADLENRAFILNGPKKGPFRLSIVEGPDWTKGVVTTADFSKEGRMQVSTVNGPLVYKLECFR